MHLRPLGKNRTRPRPSYEEKFVTLRVYVYPIFLCASLPIICCYIWTCLRCVAKARVDAWCDKYHQIHWCVIGSAHNWRPDLLLCRYIVSQVLSSTHGLHGIRGDYWWCWQCLMVIIVYMRLVRCVTLTSTPRVSYIIPPIMSSQQEAAAFIQAQSDA